MILARIRTGFWLLACSAIATYGFWLLYEEVLPGQQPLFQPDFFSILGSFLQPSFFNILALLFVLWVLAALAFFVRPGEQMLIQALRKQPSWIFYTYWALIVGSLSWSILQHFYTEMYRARWEEGYWWIGLVPALLLILLKGTNEFRRIEEDPFVFTRFASGAAGTSDDAFGFKIAANNTARAIENLKEYVNVVAIYGGFGLGKSSYSRMVIEALDPKATLYTYISLTETNEAKDFSKLFQERWIETLSSRYPKFDVTSHLPFMYSILRESGQGLLSDTLKILARLNRGLVRTKAKQHDEHYGSKPRLTNRKIGTIFGNIPEIEEKSWIIMIDELERARLDEVYRVVEIIERFRNEGRSGLPVKLVFVLCISEPDFKKYIDSCGASDPKHLPLDSFFYRDEKSITKRIGIPPIDVHLRYLHIDKLLTRVQEDNPNVGKVPNPISPHSYGTPSKRYPSEHKEALEYVYGLLAQESPRTVSRIANGVDFFYKSFRDKSGGLEVCPIRFSDVVALELVKIRYPYILDFLTKTIGYLITKSRWDGMEGYFMKKDLEKKKFGIAEWVTMETGHQYVGDEREKTEDLIGLVMHYYIDYLEHDYNYDVKIQYFGTSSYPENMYDYLSSISEGIETNHRKHSLLFADHKRGTRDFLTKLNDRDLAEYALFTYHIGSTPRKVREDLVEETQKRLVSGSIPLEALNTDETGRTAVLYQFLFQLVHLVEQTHRPSDGSNPYPYLESAFDSMKSVLLADSLDTGTKFKMLTSLATERGSGSDSMRLGSTFGKILGRYRGEFVELITHVIYEAEERYFKGEKNIYENEEDIFFMMHQYWSGDSNATKEIESIRAAAERGLSTNLAALRLHWSRYEINDNWITPEDYFEESRFFAFRGLEGAMYMPLGRLVTITKESEFADDPELSAKVSFWEKMLEHPRIQDRLKLNDDASTLKGVMLKEGFYPRKDSE